MKNLFKEIGLSFKNLLFPEKITCDICKKEIQTENTVCLDCFKKLPIIEKACQKCGSKIHSGDYCVRCKNAVLSFERCFSVCVYDKFVKNIIYRFKNGDRYLSDFMADVMAEKLKNCGIVFDVITCVPVTNKVKTLRGYNQSKLLADKIAKKLIIDNCCDFLTKTKETAFQKKITAKERKKNIQNAFAVSDKTVFKDRTVLVIDDVITTGCTLSECADILYKAKAQKVYCCTFAGVETVISLESNEN